LNSGFVWQTGPLMSAMKNERERSPNLDASSVPFFNERKR